jgi:hypothetical protein
MGRTIDWTLRFGVFAFVALLVYRAGARQRDRMQSALWLPAVFLALGLLILIVSLGAIFAFAFRNRRLSFSYFASGAAPYQNSAVLTALLARCQRRSKIASLSGAKMHQ